MPRILAMNALGLGLKDARHDEDALSVQEAGLSTLRRVGGVSGAFILGVQSNLANTYQEFGRKEEALRIRRDVHFGFVKQFGQENPQTLSAAQNYVGSLLELARYTEAKELLRNTTPLVQRVLGENDELTQRVKWIHAMALYSDPDATLDDIREAVATLDKLKQTFRRQLGGAHPKTVAIEGSIQEARMTLLLRASETPSPGSA